MGLGPPVCDKCWVIGHLDDECIDDSYWFCPVCKSRQMDAHLFDCRKSQKELDDNWRFFKFMSNIDK